MEIWEVISIRGDQNNMPIGFFSFGSDCKLNSIKLNSKTQWYHHCYLLNFNYMYLYKMFDINNWRKVKFHKILYIIRIKDLFKKVKKG